MEMVGVVELIHSVYPEIPQISVRNWSESILFSSNPDNRCTSGTFSNAETVILRYPSFETGTISVGLATNA